MKVVVNAASLRSGGGARYISEFTRQLGSQELTADFLIFLPADLPPMDVPSNPRIHLQTVRRTVWWKRVWWEQVTLRRILKNESADALFSSANFGMLLCPVRQILLIQTVIYSSSHYQALAKTFHWHERLRRVLFRWSVQGADIVMLPSRDALDGILPWAGKSKDCMIVNPFGVRRPAGQMDRDRESSTGPAENGTVRLLFVSLYYEHKNLGTRVGCGHRFEKVIVFF